MKLFQKDMKKEQILVLFLLGLLLLIIAVPVKEKENETESQTALNANAIPEESYQRKTERRLKEILSKVKGIGEVEVFLTWQNAGRTAVEKDAGETVFTKDAKGNQMPYIYEEEYPSIKGVVIVAQGGENPVVIREIQEAVQALFQVEAHKIKVMKMN